MRRPSALTVIRPVWAPFTLATLAAVVLRAWRTDTIASALPRHVVARAGFAPEDLFDLGWHRLFSSALFTHGPLEFWAAALMIVFAVGLVERLAGTVIAALTFWGVHVLTLIAESLFVALPLKLAGLQIGAQIASLRDVGPSAGYVGALGLLCALLPRPWRYAAAGLTLSALLYAMIGPDEEHLGAAALLSAGIAHLIAFPLGWWSLALWRRLRPRIGCATPAAGCVATPDERAGTGGPRTRRLGGTVAQRAVMLAAALRLRASSNS